MKMTELTAKELVEINGGAPTTQLPVALGISAGTGSLLSLSLVLRDADGNYAKSSIALLKGSSLLNLNLLNFGKS